MAPWSRLDKKCGVSGLSGSFWENLGSETLEIRDKILVNLSKDKYEGGNESRQTLGIVGEVYFPRCKGKKEIAGMGLALVSVQSLLKTELDSANFGESTMGCRKLRVE